jgi:serine/threonine protein kinase
VKNKSKGLQGQERKLKNYYAVLSIISEDVGQLSLTSLLEECGRLEEYYALEIWRKIIQGLKALRTVGVIFQDLRPSKIHLKPIIKKWKTQDGIEQGVFYEVKIGDFGFNKKRHFKKEASNLELNFKSPELLIDYLRESTPEILPTHLRDQKAQQEYSKSDVWSLGCLLFHILVGNPPYDDINRIHLIRNILSGNLWFPPHVQISKFCQTIIRECLLTSQAKRISFEELEKRVDYELMRRRLEGYLMRYVKKGSLGFQRYVLGTKNLRHILEIDEEYYQNRNTWKKSLLTKKSGKKKGKMDSKSMKMKPKKGRVYESGIEKELLLEYANFQKMAYIVNKSVVHFSGMGGDVQGTFQF